MGRRSRNVRDRRQVPAPPNADARPNSPTDPQLRALDDLARLRTTLEQAKQSQRKVVALARNAGASWYQIGLAMGTTPQAAHKRFRQPAD